LQLRDLRDVPTIRQRRWRLLRAGIILRADAAAAALPVIPAAICTRASAAATI